LPSKNPPEVVVSSSVRAVQVTETITALAVGGECDLTTAPELAAIAQGVTADGCDLIVDLTDVSFLDASTVRALLESDAAARRHGCMLVVQVDDGAFARRVLAISGADRTLAVAPTLRSAIQLIDEGYPVAASRTSPAATA
jgi:anti-sigma B factor antagonist